MYDSVNALNISGDRLELGSKKVKKFIDNLHNMCKIVANAGHVRCAFK
jgi:hypothetical protein